MHRIYLAGPDVFLPNPQEQAEKLKSACSAFGLKGVFPLDTELALDDLPPKEKARRIFSANVGLIQSCQGVLANMTPFRGPSMDVGTAWEMGCAYALGLPIVGYTTNTRYYSDRVDVFRETSPGNLFFDPEFVEDFDLIDNLMLDCSTISVRVTFELAAEALSQHLAKQP